MAIVQYHCDTCRRTIELPLNKQGLDTVGRCQITQDCRGTLIRDKVLSLHTSGKLPAPDKTGLEDYMPRKLFYKHVQTLMSDVWNIEHGLNAFPVIHAYGPNGETGAFSVSFNDANSASLYFTVPTTGVAHCVALTSTQTHTVAVEVKKADQKITYGNSIAIASVEEGPLLIRLRLSNPIRQTGIAFDITLTVSTNNHPDSPWKYVKRMYDNGKLFFVYSVDVSSIFTHEQVTDGYSIEVVEVIHHSNIPADLSSVYFLLAKEPYTSVDRLYDSFVPLKVLSADSIYLSNNSLYVSKDVVNSVYPYLKIV